MKCFIAVQLERPNYLVGWMGPSSLEEEAERGIDKGTSWDSIRSNLSDGLS